MNRTKIEWTDYSWNPVTGCKHGCWYCYAHKLFTRFGRSFEPTFHPDRLEQPLKMKKPARIFCCSVADLFAEWTVPEWRKAVFDIIYKSPQYLTFQLLTKQPHLIPEDLEIRPNIWIGATISNTQEMYKMHDLIDKWGGRKFISFEPLLGPIDFDLMDVIELKKINWVIIGKLTGSKKIKLQEEWVINIINQTRRYKIPIFLKDNLNWEEKIQEVPRW